MNTAVNRLARHARCSGGHAVRRTGVLLEFPNSSQDADESDAWNAQVGSKDEGRHARGERKPAVPAIGIAGHPGAEDTTAAPAALPSFFRSISPAETLRRGQPRTEKPRDMAHQSARAGSVCPSARRPRSALLPFAPRFLAKRR